ncbi:urea amidolyase family protein [Arthrobacter tumbae]|uniref:5-oxoprolinase subunit B/C family protein n=1 Tax=Arthrobacter tumbae TaxID=163874 RepID=UPI001958A320|nr:carboxyltransferase domain-containing protein [Arthrobacter tumbae]MBM7782294.1 KipI family sensor histidine kinase inhibitor [Arthrobacter tumbae]
MLAEIHWAGPRALLIELESLDAVLALHAQLVDHPLPGQVDVLAAARTVLAVFDSSRNARAARTAVAALDVAQTQDAHASAEPVRIEVVYDGDDLTEVGRLTGLGAAGVIEAHTGQLWTAAFGGFAPGFAYLVGENESLNVPRRTSPRTAVPAGSVGLAGNFSAVYPRRSPGGWQLIGRTSTRMWDLDRDQPALLRPGTTVQYVAVRDAIELADTEATNDDDGATRTAAAGPSLEVLIPGPQSLIQDLGRPGLGDLGVSASGAADTASARQANRLVGNKPGDAVVECVLGGLAVRAQGELTLALAGAPVPARIERQHGDGQHGDRTAPMYTPFALHDGESLHLDLPDAGLRTYLGVRGGIDVAPVLGSRSTDLMSGIGPAILAQGTVLPVGDVEHENPPVELAGHTPNAQAFGVCPTNSTRRIVGAPETSTLPPDILERRETVTLRITTGPRQDWFTPESQAALTEHSWTVTAESNRIGVRLGLPIEWAPTTAQSPENPSSAPTRSGETGGGETGTQPLERARTEELPSEGVVAGSLQVPPSGLPVLFLADHPVTGGYPVIGVVAPADLPAAAQLPPGTTVRFIEMEPQP